MNPAANVAKGRVDPQGATFCPPAGDKRKDPSGYGEQGRTGRAVEITDEFAQLNARVAAEVEDSIIDEAKTNPAVSVSLDHIALADRIADHDWSGGTVSTPDCRTTDRTMNGADNLERRGRASLHFGPRAERNQHRLQPRLLKTQ